MSKSDFLCSIGIFKLSNLQLGVPLTIETAKLLIKQTIYSVLHVTPTVATSFFLGRACCM
jgi:hypothetical protein